MYPDIEWGRNSARTRELLKSSYLLLRAEPAQSGDIQDFAASLPLRECLEKGQHTREYLVCCLSEIIRLYNPELPVSLELTLDLISMTLPGMAESMPEQALDVIRVFQWYNFATCLRNIDDEIYAASWIEMCSKMSFCDNESIVNSLPTLCLPAIDACPISRTLMAITQNAVFWKTVVRKVPDFNERLAFYFDSALENPDPVSDAHLFCTLAIADPELLGDYRMHVLDHWDPKVRVAAVKAYAKLDPNEQWRQRHKDKDVRVRRQWAQSAAEIGYQEMNKYLYADPDETVRYYAYRNPPLAEAKSTLFRLLKHPNAAIAGDAFLAYGQLCDGVADLEVILRWMTRNSSTLYESLSALRLVLDNSIESVLSIKNEKSQKAFLVVLSHTLKYYNAITSYSRLESGSTKKALMKWLDSQCEDWEPLVDDLEIDEYSSNFKRNCVPLVDAQWVIDNAPSNAFAQEILQTLASKAPALIHDKLPTISESDPPRYLLKALATISPKYPRKVVNPTTTILRDICLEGTDCSREAAEILLYGSRSLFKAIAPEMLERAIDDATENTINALMPVSKVMDIRESLRPLSSMSFVAPLYAVVCSDSELEDWVPEIAERTDTYVRSQVLMRIFENRELPTKLLPSFARDITDEVAFKLAERIKSTKVSQRLAPLLCFSEKYERCLTTMPIVDIYGFFSRLVYMLAVAGHTDVKIIRRFLDIFATADNYSTLYQVATRFKHFELKDFNSSLNLYVLSELAACTIRKHGESRNWKFTTAEEVGLPADSFSPLSLKARAQVVKTNYTDLEELAQLADNDSKPKRMRVKQARVLKI